MKAGAAILGWGGDTRLALDGGGPRGWYRLRADVRGGRIAFLLLEVPRGPDAAVEPPQIYITGLPE